MRSGFSIYIPLVLASLLLMGMSTAEAAGVSDKATLCAGCHGTAGISVSPMVPNLAGQKKDYLIKALNDFRTGKRKEAIMMSIVQTLSDTDISELAAYFSALHAAGNETSQN